MAAYEACMKRWPVPFETRDVFTRFGSTHIIVSGPKNAPPLVLLPGMASSSTSWLPNIAALARSHRTYALDTIADVGKSKATDPPKDRSESARWLVRVFDELDIGKTDVVGASYGGFLTANLALKAPDRVKRIVLIAPAMTFATVNIGFYLRAVANLLLPFEMVRKYFMKWMMAEGNYEKVEADYPEHLAQMNTAMQVAGRPGVADPKVLTDAELKQLGMPVLLLIGEHEVIADVEPAVERARALVKDIQVEVVSGAGHSVAMEQPETVNSLVLTFLER